MGYYITLQDANFVVPAEHVDEAFTVVKALNLADSLKRGGSWSGGQQTEAWFSWMDADYDKTTSNLAEVMEMLGFDTETTDEGVALVGYDSKTGQEDLFLLFLAMAVPDDSYLAFEGEDGYEFRYVVKNRRLHLHEGGILSPMAFPQPTQEEAAMMAEAVRGLRLPSAPA